MRSNNLRLHVSADESSWIASATDALANALALDLATHPCVRLLLSGGSTPGPIYCALATRALEWARIDVGLVDDRWVAHDSPASNARLIRETLLRTNTAIAFLPLPTSGKSTEADARRASEAFALTPDAACTAVFGMGPDGHIASLIPGSDGFAEAVQSSDVYVAIHAPDSNVAAPWPDRISLSRAGIARAQRHMLLIRGDEKRAVLERALEGDDVGELPIRLLLQESTPLDVYWCP